MAGARGSVRLCSGGSPEGLQKFLREEHGEDAASMRVNDDLAPWILSKVRGEYRPSSKRSGASRALWRAYRALAAARYHLRGDVNRSGRLRELRDEVETHWTDVTPMRRSVAD